MTKVREACTVRATYDGQNDCGQHGTAHDEFQLLGGESVFASVTDRASHASRAARALIASGAGGRFALAGARCGRRLPARYGPAPEVHLTHVHRTGGHR